MVITPLQTEALSRGGGAVRLTEFPFSTPAEPDRPVRKDLGVFPSVCRAGVTHASAACCTRDLWESPGSSPPLTLCTTAGFVRVVLCAATRFWLHTFVCRCVV